MNRVVEYVGEVLPDGHLSVPEDVLQSLALAPHMRIQITIKPLQPDSDEVREGWNALRKLGQGATAGRLPDASSDHDRYLYGKQS